MAITAIAEKILLGLFGLGIVVFVHESGHFLGARAMGIAVETFSIGWGKALVKKKIGETEYRLSLFPMGGYCKMRGDSDYQKAYETKADEYPPGSYFGVKPWRRIVVCIAGPLFNLLFSMLVLTIIWGVGFEVETLDNRIVLASDITPGETYPADKSGLLTGDRIVLIGSNEIANYHDIQEAIIPNAEVTLPVRVDRNGVLIDLTLRPLLDKSTGAGKIGVYFWTDPIIAGVSPGGLGEKAGLQAGDRIVRINGEDFPYTVAIFRILQNNPPELAVEFERAGILHTTLIPVSENGQEGIDLGIAYHTLRYRSPRYSPLGALAKGSHEAWKTLVISVQSLSLLFRGIDLTRAVSGPVRITYLVGEAAAEGFEQSFGAGVSSMASFLSLISIALCMMNLLPLPILDGGLVILFVIETIKGKALHPKAIFAFQTLGVVLICSLMLFAFFGDILFLIRR